jgi:indolepyruvate ferredoxin oxidoreductase
MLSALRLLRHGKVLRGTPLDIFGRTEERRTERALPGEFRAGMERWLANLTPESHARACEWAEAWAGVKGFGHIKQRNLAAVREKLTAIEAAPARALDKEPVPA